MEFCEKNHNLDEPANKAYVYMISLIAAVGGFLFGYDLNIVAGASIYLKDAFQLTPNQFGFAISCAMFGCVLGPIIGGWMADFFGRRNTLLIAALLFGVSAVGTAIPRTLFQFNVFRIIGGVGVGLASVVSPMYIAEVAPARIRGRLVTLNQFAIVLGSLVSIVVAYYLAKYLPEELSWRWMFGSECVPILVFLIALWFIPRSPRWLMQKNRITEANAVLARIDGPEHAKAEVEEIGAALLEERGGFAELFSHGVRVAIIIGVVLAFLQQWIGGSALITYAPIIFQKAGFESATDALFQTILLGIFNIGCVIIAIFIIDRVSRRLLFMVGAAGMGIGLALMGVVFHMQMDGKYLLFAMFAAMLMYQVSMGPLAWLIISEIFPTNVRAKGMCISAVAIWLSAASSVYAFPLLKAYFEKTFGNPASLFWMYSIVCVITFIFGWRMIPETKGKTLEQIAKSWLHRED